MSELTRKAVLDFIGQPAPATELTLTVAGEPVSLFLRPLGGIDWQFALTTEASRHMDKKQREKGDLTDEQIKAALDKAGVSALHYLAIAHAAHTTKGERLFESWEEVRELEARLSPEDKDKLASAAQDLMLPLLKTGTAEGPTGASRAASQNDGPVRRRTRA